ncbi:MAG: translation initiation factor IF-2 subunit alpha [archaeon]|nr:translation initiation factor IF-2 subunit alpha [archaeon]
MTEEMPEPGEIVIGKISKVLNYGVFLDLMEYEGMQGFVHISNVSSSWIKNIRNFVKEGQIRAGKVLAVNPEKRQIDISLTKVSPSQQRSKIEGYKQGKRAQKLVELLAENTKTDFDTAWAEVAEPLLERHDSLYDAFQLILVKGDDALEGIPKKWVAPLKELVEKNIELPEKSVRGRLVLNMPGPSGVESVKLALEAGQKKGGKRVEIFYEGSGKYAVKVSSADYKSAEKLLKDVSDEIASSAKSLGGKTEFEKVVS